MPVEKVSKVKPVSGFEPPWFYATEESNLIEGRFLRVEPAGRNVLVLKAEGQIQAFINLCPHAGCPLDKGRLEEFTLTCLCHVKKFDVRTGESLNSSLKLRRYETRLMEGRIGVKLE